ncbi:MAG: RidA family protein [Bacteroidetes bacterium]|jgi:2-aminomuconate deaminase|nr:RidA family protein [Bacteroidota bacterium]
MADQHSIHSENAPKPVGSYPHAKKVGNLLFLSGIGPRVKDNAHIPGVELDAHGNVLHHDIVLQAESVFANVRTVLESAGAQWADLVDVTIFLTDMKGDFKKFNEVWAKYFPVPGPCRTTVEILSLPTPIAIELKCIAAIKEA